MILFFITFFNADSRFSTSRFTEMLSKSERTVVSSGPAIMPNGSPVYEIFLFSKTFMTVLLIFIDFAPGISFSVKK